MKTLVFGKNGQVARALSEIAPEWIYLSSQEAPFTDTKRVLAHLNTIRPQVVINAAAYTAVDKAETEQDLAFQVNAKTPGIIADWCAENSATMIHYSTDYVFDGTGDRPWVETDQPNPINWYGQTKWDGEKLIQGSGCHHYIFRVSWVYSPWGNCFPNTILRLAQEKEELRIVSDQWGAPTDARDVARVTTDLMKKILRSEGQPEGGIYHLCFEPYTSWYLFSRKIIEIYRQSDINIRTKSLIPISTSELPTSARRPLNSRLGTIRNLF